MAAAILIQGDGKAGTTPPAPPRRPEPPDKPELRQKPPTASERRRQEESRKAERSLQTLLQLAARRGEKTAYLLALDFLTELSRRATHQTRTGEKAAGILPRRDPDDFREEHLRNIILVAGAYIPPGSSLTLREAHAQLGQG
jgi:hypothetical protein